MGRCKNTACSLVTEVFFFFSPLFSLEVVRAPFRYDRWNVWGHYNCRRGAAFFEDVTSHHEVSQTETSKRRSQSSCLSVSLSPACQSVTGSIFEHQSLTPVKELCVRRLYFYICNQNNGSRSSIWSSDHGRLQSCGPSDIPPRKVWCCNNQKLLHALPEKLRWRLRTRTSSFIFSIWPL